jgi:hypothetical protein
MRASEFITEGKKRSSYRALGRGAPSREFEAAHTNIIAPHGRGDLYIGRYYDFYKVAVLAGMDPEDLENQDLLSFFGNLPVFSGYSDIEREKLFKVMTKLGLKPTDYIPSGSTEMDDTNVKSPVTGFKGFK